ncbi:MAG TPA: hypothetical protein VMX76_02400 [Nevskiaceae bacterium]|nr:hypothetical protein [Nevskiaceae bacterium]
MSQSAGTILRQYISRLSFSGGEVLGEGEEATTAFYPLEGAEEESEETTPSSKNLGYLKFFLFWD